MTILAHLNLNEDPAVVQMMYDYGESAAPDHMVPPDFVDVTDEDPLPEPGYTYDGTTWRPGAPQLRERLRATVANTVEQSADRNREFLENAEPTDEEVAAQVADLTRQVMHLQQIRLEQYGREQDWSEFQPHVDIEPPPVLAKPPAEEVPEEPVDDGKTHVYSVDPASGPTSGGNQITIYGMHLAGIGGVNFQRGNETQWAWGFQVVDDQTLTATMPQMSAGAVDVVVLANGVETVLENGYTYT